jgi:hypothetical protein
MRCLGRLLLRGLEEGVERRDLMMSLLAGKYRCRINLAYPKFRSTIRGKRRRRGIARYWKLGSVSPHPEQETKELRAECKKTVTESYRHHNVQHVTTTPKKSITSSIICYTLCGQVDICSSFNNRIIRKIDLMSSMLSNVSGKARKVSTAANAEPCNRQSSCDIRLTASRTAVHLRPPRRLPSHRRQLAGLRCLRQILPCRPRSQFPPLRLPRAPSVRPQGRVRRP